MKKYKLMPNNIIVSENNEISTLTIICWICNKEYSFNVSTEQLRRYIESPRILIQRAFPTLSAENRELIISRTCNNCFKELIPEDEEESNEIDLTNINLN